MHVANKNTTDEEKNLPVNAYTPPNGGVKAWACVAGSFLLQFCSFGYVNACALLLCKEYWQVMLAQGVAFGLAAAGLCLPAMALATQWFSTKRGLAVGIVSAGSSLGGVIYPCMLPRLINEVGFASAVRWTALMQGILLLLANILCSRPFPPKTKEESGDKSTSKAGLDGFKNWPRGFFILGCFFTMWGLFAPLNYLPEMASLHGMSDFAQYTLAIANAGSLIGRIVPGWMSDRIGQFNMMCTVTSLSGILVLAFWLPLEFHTSMAGVIVFALLFGFVSGGFVSLGPPCVVSLTGDSMDSIGVKLGGFCLAIALGALTGLPIEGAIKDREGDRFTGLMCFSGVAMILGGLCTGTARVIKGGAKIWQKI